MLPSWIRKLFATSNKPIVNRRTILNLETLEDRSLPSAALPIDTATLSLSNSAIDENQWSGSLVGTFSQHIAGAQGYTSYQLVSGAGSGNNGAFTIAGDQLRTTKAFNFEANPTLNIRVRATASNGVTSTEQFTITVADVNEAPTNVTLGPKTVKENSAGGTLVGTLGAKDPDAGSTQTYSLVDSAGGRFQINGDRLEVADGANLDFEQQQSFYVRIRVTDNGGLSTEQGFDIAIKDVKEAPTGLTLYGNSVVENSAAGTYVGNIAVQDPDGGEAPVLSLVNSAGGRFELSGNNLVVKNSALLNYEAATSHQVTIRAKDATGLFVDGTYTINVINANEAPKNIALSNKSITLPASSGALVGLLSATDPDANQQFNFILTDNAGGKFQTNGDRLEITNSDVFKWDPKPTYDIKVMVLDQSGASYEKTFTITVTNAAQIPANQAPNSISLSGNTVIENSQTGSYIGYVSATDPDSYTQPTLSLFDSAGGRFKLSGGNLVVDNAALLNFELATSHQVTIRATDAGGLSYDQVFTINVTNANETPTNIALSNAAITLPASAGALVGLLSATDPDANPLLTYILTDNAGGKFQTNGDRLEIINSDNFKWDPKPTYDIKVMVLDQGGASFEKTFTITVTNAAQIPANQAPNSISLSGNTVIENSPTGSYIGYVSATDPDSYTQPTLTLFDSAGGRFKLSGGNLVVDNALLLDFETATSYQVTIRATDAGGLSYDQVFTINVINANEAPTGVSLSNASLALPTQAGAVVGTFSTTDPDANQQFTYILTDNAGGKFQMNGATVVVTDPNLFNWDAQPSYNIHLLVLDQGGQSYEKWFTITVTGTVI